MKYLAKSQNNKMVQLGEDIKRGKWFYITDAVVSDIDSLKVGDDITFVSEPRGGAFYITFIAKGTVEVPVQAVKEPVVMSTPVNTPAKVPYQKWTPSPKSDMSKEDWAEKERRDFKGRSVAYASSAMTALLANQTMDEIKDLTEEQYLEQLLRIAKKIEEYIYK